MDRRRLLNILWIAPLVLFSPALFAGLRMYYGALSLQFVPWRWAGFQMMGAGDIPLWNALSGFGAPLLANYQSAFLYPLNWLLLPFARLGGLDALAWAQGALAAAHLVLAGWGMARLVRALGPGVLAQAVAGLAYGLSGYLVARTHFLSINAAAAWLPWVLLAVYRVVRGNGRQVRGGFAGLVGAAAMLLLAGHAQTAWYTFLLAGAWAVFWLSRPPDATAHSQNTSAEDSRDSPVHGLHRGARLFLLGAGVLLGLCIAAAQLLPTAELLAVSQRSGGAAEGFVMTYSFWPWRFLGLFLPGLFGSPASGNYWGYATYWEDAIYIGLLPVLLALRTVFSRKTDGERRALVGFLSAVTLLSFLLALGNNTPVFPWLYRNVPTFDLFQAPTRYSIWAVFSLALLAGLGAQSWSSTVSSYSRHQAARWTSVGLAFVLAGVLILMFLPGIEPSFGRSTLAAGVIGTFYAALGLARRRNLRWQAAVILLVAADLVYAGWGLNPVVDPALYREPAPNAAVLRQRLEGGRLYLFESDEYALIYDRYFPFRSFQVDLTGLRGSLLPNLNLFEGLPSASQFDPLVPASFAAWTETVERQPPDVQAWLLAQSGVSVLERYDPARDESLRFVTQPAASRVAWAPCALSAASAAEALELLVAAYPAAPPLFIEHPGNDLPNPCESGLMPQPGGTVRIVSEGAGELTVRVEADAAGWLLLRDTHYPGWEAEIDGEQLEIYRANGVFRAVEVPAGRHEIVWTYDPASFSVGLTLTTIGLVLFGATLYYFWLKGRRE